MKIFHCWRRGFAVVLSGMLLLPGLDQIAAAAVNRGGGHALASLPLFNPRKVDPFLPLIQGFNQWSRTDIGKRLIAGLPEKDRQWVSLLQGVDAIRPEDASLMVISPLVQDVAGTEIENRMREHISKLEGSLSGDEAKKLSEAEQEASFRQVVSDFSATRDKMAPQVAEEISALQKKFAAKLKKSGANSRTVKTQVSQLKGLVSPLSFIYGWEEAHYDPMALLAKTLTVAEMGQKKVGDEDFDTYTGPTFLKLAQTAAADAGVVTPEAQPDAAPAGQAQSQAVGQPSGIASIVESGQFPHTLLSPEVSTIKFGRLKVKRVMFPNIPKGQGDDIEKVLVALNGASQHTRRMVYELGLPEYADSIIKNAAGGAREQTLLDYSNTYPSKGDRKEPLDLLVHDSLSNSNNEVRIIQGDGGTIQHAKYNIYVLKDAIDGAVRIIAQGGTFNFTKTSQDNHWETVVVVEDLVTIALLIADFEWAWQMGRKFKEGMKPKNPVFKEPTPRATQEQMQRLLHTTPFPNASFSPRGDTLDWRIKMVLNTVEEFWIEMFGVYTPAPLKKVLLDFLKKKLYLRILADYGQSHNPASLAVLTELAENGADVRLVSGPNEPDPTKSHNMHEKDHNKIMMADPNSSGGLITLGSTNDSRRAYGSDMTEKGQKRLGNFETSLYLPVDYLVPVREVHNEIWKIGRKPDFDQLKKLIESSEEPAKKR